MTERSFLFDSEFDPATGKPDRAMNSTDFARVFNWFLGSGIIKGFKDELKVIAQGSGMKTVVQPGAAFVEGRPYSNDANIVLTHDPADATKTRVDEVVLRLDLSKGKRSINVVVKKGALGANVPPLLQEDDVFSGGLIFEIPLAIITITPGKSYIDNSQIANQHSTGIYIDLMSISGMYLKQDDAKTLYTYNASTSDGWYTVGNSPWEQLRVIRQYNGMCTIGGQVMGGNLGADRYVAAFNYWARPNKTIPLTVIGADGSWGYWYLEPTGNLRQTGITPKTGNVHIIPASYVGVGANEVAGQ
ncbi:hypothetical protein ACFQZ1_08110 [Bacillus sp. CGMCC 1.60114]|uniref:hypothetical protein n=1 Tax=unclassified Bacillus (in: firmicutes) TaxID=185979 RepID=UPI00362D6874